MLGRASGAKAIPVGVGEEPKPYKPVSSEERTRKGCSRRRVEHSCVKLVRSVRAMVKIIVRALMLYAVSQVAIKTIDAVLPPDES